MVRGGEDSGALTSNFSHTPCRPVILKIIVGLFILFILSLIYLPRSVKHRWEVKFMVAQGWTLRQWFVYLARHNFVVDPIYWHRALFITVIRCAGQ